MSLSLQMRNYRLTTAEILYHLPDHPGLLQTYILQDLDLAPRFPQLQRFLNFWSHEIEGKLHSIRVAGCDLIQPGKLSHANHVMTLH